MIIFQPHTSVRKRLERFFFHFGRKIYDVNLIQVAPCHEYATLLMDSFGSKLGPGIIFSFGSCCFFGGGGGGGVVF